MTRNTSHCFSILYSFTLKAPQLVILASRDCCTGAIMHFDNCAPKHIGTSAYCATFHINSHSLILHRKDSKYIAWFQYTLPSFTLGPPQRVIFASRDCCTGVILHFGNCATKHIGSSAYCTTFHIDSHFLILHRNDSKYIAWFQYTLHNFKLGPPQLVILASRDCCTGPILHIGNCAT
jgi:hypothetical protein